MTTNPSASEERILAHLGFARAVASRTLDPRCRGADREDLIAAGVVGLVQAAQRYRGEVGASFGAYAARRVRGQVLDALRERDPLTRSARRAYREAQRVAEDLPPPYVEISLDRLAELGDGAIAEPDAVATDTRRDPRWHGVARELRSLGKIERRVLVLSYGRGLTLREIGTQVGLSESGVCRVRARALRRLRSALAESQEAAEIMRSGSLSTGSGRANEGAAARGRSRSHRPPRHPWISARDRRGVGSAI